jgi:predicted ATPase
MNMRIRKIKYENHPLFGNTEFDFTNDKGNTVNTIIIAGENGVGKSLLLNDIFDFSNNKLSENIRDEKKMIEFEITNSDLEILKNHSSLKHYFTTTFSTKIFQISYNYNLSSWDQINVSFKINGGFSPPMVGTVFALKETKRILNCLFSDVEINFNSKSISTVTSGNLDNSSLSSQRSNTNLATEITQLLIDVQSLDALELNEWVRNNRGKVVEENIVDTRIRRFTTAFDYIFETKKYKRIENLNKQKQIIFQEGDREMNINQLSSGEKQIVFRGGFLIKDKESSKGALVLIDEPEISMHPNWQLKILNFFKKLFTSSEGIQTSQLIIATHSPFIIHNSNRMDDKVIVLKRNEENKTIILHQPKFLGWSSEKIVKEAFSIENLLSNEKTTVFVEGITDEQYFNKAIELFQLKDIDLQFKWIGRIGEKGNVENSGDTALNHAKTFFVSNPEHTKNKVILLYDSDTNKPEEENGNLLIRKMNINKDNTVFKIGVENLLQLTSEFNFKNFYKEKTKVDDYGAESIIRELNKTQLCDYICNELDIEAQKKVFQNIKKEIDRLS